MYLIDSNKYTNIFFNRVSPSCVLGNSQRHFLYLTDKTVFTSLHSQNSKFKISERKDKDSKSSLVKLNSTL